MTLESRFSLPQRLAASATRVDDLVGAIGRERRIDVAGVPNGTFALVVARAALRGRRLCLLTPDATTAQTLVADVRFFLGEHALDAQDATSTVWSHPAPETSAFLQVSADRRAAMDRMAVLARLARNEPWRVLVVPVAAALRRVAPRADVRARTSVLRVGDAIERDGVIAALLDAGYLRVPVVEDPGSFAVRGALLDVFPAGASAPARIELDADRIVAIHTFDPDDQRRHGPLDDLRVGPARGVLQGAAELERTRARLSDLCDRVNLPSKRRRALLDDLAAGRLALGLDALLPAFHDTTETLFDYLPSDAVVALAGADAMPDAVSAEIERADRDHAARAEQHDPVFEVDALYLSPQELAARVSAHPAMIAHAVAALGAPDPAVDDPIEALCALGLREPWRLAAEDHAALVAELRARRKHGGSGDPLGPLVGRARGWLEEGLRVVASARTRAQAERLDSLLRDHALPTSGPPAPFDPARTNRAASGKIEIVLGDLSHGFALAAEAIVFVTETDVFGARAHARPARRKADARRAFVSDLRELAVGDWVVHSEHGVGRYLGLTRAELPVTRHEALMGLRPKHVESLVIEYAGGDRLYLPVTRLDQLDKHASADGATPKLDRLGGQTFARTKARTRAAVKILADELLAIHAERAARERPPHAPTGHDYAEFEAGFPYEETPDQTRAIEEVMHDLDAPRPMDRLVCGDVGFGKTEVALRAAFRVAMGGRQVAVLCPTTVLAHQHFTTFRARFEPYPLRVEMLSRFVPKKQQAEALRRVREGSADVVIGTHRLLSKDVHFRDLGLLVVDEEQRFGVAHKERIKKLRAEVDVLTLSATPIPRTLHMALGGLRDMSLIATAPVDRRAVRTFVTRWDEHVLREAIRRELARGGQVFFVHNRIEHLYDRAARLAEIAPDARIATAHGRMKESLLERTMTDFVAGEYDVLCSTAIVENGLDIPRANTILVDRADAMGLSQLYQLRGRVGRSSERGYCYLIAPPPSDLSDEARARIEALERFSELGSGFSIASLDMELRGAGDLLGEAQHGTLTAVGLDLFVRMLEDAVAELRGETVVRDVEPEITVDVEHYLPDDYVEDVGLRLSLYKRLASVADEDEVQTIAAEVEDRFGPPPRPAIELVRVMSLKPSLRALRVLGCEARARRVVLRLADDTPLDRQALVALVHESKAWQLQPDGALVRRFAETDAGDAIDRVRTVLRELGALLPAGSAAGTPPASGRR